MLIAVLSVTLVYHVAWRQFLQNSLLAWVFSAAFLVMVVGSATLWILIAFDYWWSYSQRRRPRIDFDCYCSFAGSWFPGPSRPGAGFS
jgi:hypothetical protein